MDVCREFERFRPRAIIMSVALKSVNELNGDSVDGLTCHVGPPDDAVQEGMTMIPAESPSGFARLDGARAVVTGASTGIGRAIAVALAEAGADLLLHSRDSREVVEELAGVIRADGCRAEVLQADLSNDGEVDSFFDQAWRLFEGVDIWINNAGVDLLTGVESDLEYDEKLERLWQVDVRGTIRLARAAGLRMRDATGGVVLNVGWDQAERGMEGDSGELFAAAKGAVMSFTRSLALSLAPQVRVNCIAAGWIRTAWGEQASESWQERVLRETPLGRWGTPEDIARLARFLVSAEADYLTGQVIYANGGAVR